MIFTELGEAAESGEAAVSNADQHDSCQTRMIFHENPTHRQHALTSFLVATKIPSKPQSAPQAFVLNESVSFQQSHWTKRFRRNLETFRFQNSAPLLCCQRSGTDMNRL